MEKSEVLVVGGGVMGLSIAYNLLKNGVKTTILEGDYLNAGSTGRNMGVVKIRIPEAIDGSDKDMITLAEIGLKTYTRFSSETGINIFFRKSGCLTVAEGEDELKLLEKNHQKLAELGEREELLTADEISARWRYINSRAITGGAYSSKDVMVHPFGVTWALVESIKRLNGSLKKLDRVQKVTREEGHYKVSSSNGEAVADKMVLAAGGESMRLANDLGYKIPLEEVRKEMLISEAMRPFFGPTIERLSNGYQIAQTMRGEIMGTMGDEALGGENLDVTSQFLTKFADQTISLIPAMRNLRILRQWAGALNRAPDAKPIVGQLEDNLYVTCGFNEYGLTLAPAVGQLISTEILDGTKSPLLKAYKPDRF